MKSEKKMSSSSESSGGIGFLGLLTIVFIVLKLTDVIDWSWWLVLLPAWGPITLLLLFLMLVLLPAKALKGAKAQR